MLRQGGLPPRSGRSRNGSLVNRILRVQSRTDAEARSAVAWFQLIGSQARPAPRPSAVRP
jgi:hypothetical protein